MNKYTNMSEDEMLGVCYIINPNAKWHFNQLLDNDGNGTDDCYEFLSDHDDIIQFNIHQSVDDEIRCYLGGDIDNDDLPEDKIILIDSFINRQYHIEESQSNSGGPYNFNMLKRKNIKSSTNIWYEGLNGWTAASNVDELKGLFTKNNIDTKNHNKFSNSSLNTANSEKAEQSWISVLLICWFFGIFGGHRFYTGNIKSGLIQLFTLGGFYVWWLIDFFTILSGNFKNSEGKIIKK